MMSNLINAIEREFTFNDSFVGGAEAMILTSEETAEKIIQAFEKAVAAGYNPLEVQDEIFSQINTDNLLPADKERINRKVNEIWASHENSFDHYA